ncbi:di-heme oxidoredictase family protein [Bernardetia sp.]|uniref:di-heme oxidoreductase family protein n=1 Tax=Bernardetia sp. TaxID=1937974 RepID=UPI0025BEA45E|nr:di-heme oxidoredictase family protein [Bernardetia sp.]
MRFYFLTLLCSTFLLFSCQDEKDEPIFEESEIYAGGNATTFDQSVNAFGHAANGLTAEENGQFVTGNSFFKANWVMAPSSTVGLDGLGAFFSARSCSGCHAFDGRGNLPQNTGDDIVALVIKLSVRNGIKYENEPTYGSQLSSQAIFGIEPEGNISISHQTITGNFTDGTTYTLQKPIYNFDKMNYGNVHPNTVVSPRLAPHIAGLGLLEAVSEQTILSFADENDMNNDGISGKPNYVLEAETGQVKLGRFGLKANQATIREQVAGAFNGDMGITSSIHPIENCTDIQQNCKDAISGSTEEEMEISESKLAKVVLYCQTLAVPARRDAENTQVLRGKELFSNLNCNKCHIPKMKTDFHEIKALSNQTIYPYTDLLLHDMGDELADNRPDFGATGNEWRTPPLWGLGMIQRVNPLATFMHDGRAKTIEEAILWHGGEAENSKEKYIKLSKDSRTDLLTFLNSL